MKTTNQTHLKQWLILAAAITLAFVLSICAFATDGAGLSDLYVVIDGQTILATNVNGETWFLLPSHTDLNAVALYYTAPDGAAVTIAETAAASGNSVDVRTLAGYDEASSSYTLPYTVTTDDTVVTARLHFMKTENVGAMYISVSDPAYGRNWVDGSPNHSNDAGKKTTVTMKMQTADASVVYDGSLTSLKGRGNTTWASSLKKPYQIKLDKKTDLLSSGKKENKNKTWVLLANALDKSLIKTSMALDIAEYLQMKGTPEHTYVNLYFDGEYRGLYQLTEKVQINSGRVEIAELEEHNSVEDEAATAKGTNKFGMEYQYNPTAVCDTDDISGGYLLEQDVVFYRSENSWFRLFDGSVIVVKSPECCTREQMVYISERFYEAAMAARDNTYEGKSVTELFDIDSLASLYIINEYTQNWDFTASSTYFFLPESGNSTYEDKFYGGPAWDFDTSLGNRTELEIMRDPTGLLRDGSTMFRGSVVRSAIKDKAKKLEGLYDILFAKEPTQRNGISSFSWYKAYLDAAQKMNFTIWPFDNTPNTFAKPSYDENYTYIRDFLQVRHADILPRIAAWKTPDYNAVKNCCAGSHTPVPAGKAPTCTKPGQTGSFCSVCGKVFEETKDAPALGHIDNNGDGFCDNCGGDISRCCRYCDEIHPNNFIGNLTQFFHNIAYFFARLFGRK